MACARRYDPSGATGGRRQRRAILAVALLAVSGSLEAHDREPSWIQQGALDQGVFVGLSHARVIRSPRAFDVHVLVNNVDGEGEVLVRSVRHSGQGSLRGQIGGPDLRLPSQRARLAEYLRLKDRLEHALGREARRDVEALLAERAQILSEVASRTLVQRISIDPSDIGASSGAVQLAVEVDLEQDGVARTVRREVYIPVEPALPDGRGPALRIEYDASTSELSSSKTEVLEASWLAGDQHLHTAYSLDALLVNGTTSTVTGYANAAQVAGLDWIIVTDHSNVSFDLLGTTWYSEELFDAGAAEAAAVRAESGFLVLNGQEMGVGAQGLLGTPAHLLAYPRSVDSTGFLPNPCSGLVFNHVNCEAEQLIIDRVNTAGGIGFVAHPFSSSETAYSPWDFDNGVTGWAGFEIFNGSSLGDDDVSALVKWFELLAEIAAPTGGELPERSTFPTRFPVGLGNSDAHELGEIGSTFSYCRLAETTREAVVDSFVHGRCVASNGPLAFVSVNGAGAGDVALVTGASNSLEITLQTTPEFGPVGDYTLALFANGVSAGAIPPSGSTEYSVTYAFEGVSLGPGLRFLNLVAASNDGRYYAIANPLWLEH